MEKILTFVFNIFAKVKWDFLTRTLKGRSYALTPIDWGSIGTVLLDNNYYIILTHRSTHLTTYLIAFANWVKTGKWGYWSHALMNVEGTILPSSRTVMSAKYLTDVFRFVEATAVGVHYSSFFEVFDCDGVCLLKVPSQLTDKIEAEIVGDIGKPYDNLLDYLNDSKVSCAELVWDLITDEDDDIIKFCPNLYKQIVKTKNITPDMYYYAAEKGDFEIALEIRRRL